MRSHGRVFLKLTLEIDKIFKRHAFKLYIILFDVWLIDFKKSFIDNKIITVVQPDLCVVYDLSKVDKKAVLAHYI